MSLLTLYGTGNLLKYAGKILWEDNIMITAASHSFGTAGCFSLPVTSCVAGLLDSSFSIPKLRNPLETRRKAEEMLTVQPITYLKCSKHFFLLSGLEAQHPHPGNSNSEVVTSPYPNPTEGESGQIPYLQWVWVQNVMRVWFFSLGFPS